jgi:hypothetical protein
MAVNNELEDAFRYETASPSSTRASQFHVNFHGYCRTRIKDFNLPNICHVIYSIDLISLEAVLRISLTMRPIQSAVGTTPEPSLGIYL